MAKFSKAIYREKLAGELASIAPVAQLMITGIPLWILFGLINLNKYCLNRKDPHQYGKPVELQRI